MPKVSVCIPAYNRLPLFRATFWSVLKQTFSDFEVIVGDNASQEDLAGEIALANDARVRYIRHAVNMGGPANFRYLAKLARGEYILFLCSDDLLLPHALAKAVSSIDECGHCGGVVFMAAHYSSAGFQFFSTMPDRQVAGAEDYARDRTVRDFSFTSPSLCLYRRSTFERLGGWRSDLLAVGDWDLYARMVRYGGGMKLLHDVLAIMRLHNDRDSNTGALHWGFYHDVLLLSRQSDYQWGIGYRTMALTEQLLWDIRLKRSPWRTLSYAYKMDTLWKALLFLPLELARRIGIKIRIAISGRLRDFGQRDPRPPKIPHDLARIDEFWRMSENIRAGF